jgi:hypothetical protein
VDAARAHVGHLVRLTERVTQVPALTLRCIETERITALFSNEIVGITVAWESSCGIW